MKPFLKHLLEANGYEEYTYQQYKQDQNNKEGMKLNQNYYIVVTGDTTDSIDFINKTFNKKKNKYGNICRILIGTSAINEGVSLKAVRQTHLLYINNNYSMETMIQIFGRAVRGDSHDQFKSRKDRYTRRYIHMHTYSDHDMNIDFKLNEFKEIQRKYFKNDEGPEIVFPDNETVLNMNSIIKNIFDPDNKIEKKKEYNEKEEEIMIIFETFLNYDYVVFEIQLREIEEDYKEQIEKTIKDKETFDKYKKVIYVDLFDEYKSFIYYPYDLYSYLRAFTKYIKNKKILNIFIKIAVDCNLNKESNKVKECIPNITKIGKIDDSTYKHEHNVSKLEYISESIKKLFERKKYYKYDELIDYFISPKPENTKDSDSESAWLAFSKQYRLDNPGYKANEVTAAWNRGKDVSKKDLVEIGNTLKRNLPTYIDDSEVSELIDLALKEMVPDENIDITIFPHKIIHKKYIKWNHEQTMTWLNTMFQSFPKIFFKYVKDREIILYQLLKLNVNDLDMIDISFEELRSLKNTINEMNELGYITQKGNVVSFQNAIGIKYTNVKHETLMKKEEYLTDIFTNIKYGIATDVKYKSLEDYFKENKDNITLTKDIERMSKKEKPKEEEE